MDLVSTARNPVPGEAIVGTLTSYDGTGLRFARWNPSAGGRNGTVCVFGGRTEFIEKYYETIADLRRRGFAVAIMDWRGQGGSGRALRDRRKGHVHDFAEFDRDLEHFMIEIVLPDCPPPYFALAHSMGGLVLLRAACRKDCWFDRMVLCAPMIQLANLPLPQALAGTLTGLAVYAGLGDLSLTVGRHRHWDVKAFDGNILTSDERRFRRNQEVLERAPELQLGPPTVGWARAAFEAMKAAGGYGFPRNVHVPILMLAAGRDEVVSSKAIEIQAAQLKAGSHIDLRLARHEILQERDELREQAWAAFDAFVPGTG